MAVNRNGFGERLLGYSGGVLLWGGISTLGYGLYRLYNENWTWADPITLILFLASIPAVLMGGVILWTIDQKSSNNTDDEL